MKRWNNKGAALVAVLIGVLFITILASSLLYMSTMNYQMKGMRYQLTDNFYTAEFAIEDMMAQMRQQTQMHVDTCTTYAEIEALLNVQTKDGHKVYDCDKLRDLIHIDGRDAAGNIVGTPIVDGIAGVKVSTIYREKNDNDSPFKDYGAYTYDTYEETGEGVILHGVKITVTTLTPEGVVASFNADGTPNPLVYGSEAEMKKYSDYESTISFDLEFAFPKYATTKSGSISDFSILSDTPVAVCGGNHVFTGSLYARANGYSGALPQSGLSIGGTTAFYVGGKAVCTVAGPFAFFQGNLVVADGGVMFISGNCTVNGNIKLGPTSTLYVAGDLKVRGSITNSSRVLKSGNVSVNDSTVDWTHYDDKYADGLAAKLVVPNIHLFVGTDAQKVTGYGGDKTNLTMTPTQFRRMCGDGNPSDFCSSTTVDGHTVRAIFSMASTNNTVTYENALVVGFNNVNIHGEFKNSTFINLGRYSEDGGSSFTTDVIEMDEGLQAHPNTWGHMSDKDYAAACDLLFCYGSAPAANSSAQVRGTGYNVGFPENGLLASNITPDTTTGAATNARKLGALDLVEYGYEGVSNNIKFYRSKNPVSVGGGSVYVNYFPYGNFFSDKMGEVMDDFMSAGASSSISTGGTSGFDKTATPALIISHWTKE